eukprot:TRINITY_DN5315_c0_g1_i2.p1 TRINITY_DN5315_c0_g1~~TRINITY_DN5315_c0_g1_i2.p1  ORF type:complete len:130 (-),score=12.29 TRINITY_DN5315_c0_g1_i2:90-479(-)
MADLFPPIARALHKSEQYRRNRKVLSLSDVAPFFTMPIAEAARRLGVCATLIKRCCREHGIRRITKEIAIMSSEDSHVVTAAQEQEQWFDTPEDIYCHLAAPSLLVSLLPSPPKVDDPLADTLALNQGS